jgi:GDP-L-fucose synthase
MKKILITGTSGFLGRNVLKEFKETEYDLLVPKSKQLNLLDENKTKKYLQKFKPDTVIHLAGSVGGIGANKVNPGKFFYENMKMGMNLIHLSKECGVKHFVMTGTICSYPGNTPVPFKEDNLWNGYPEPTNAPYGIAKKALLVMLQSYKQQYDFNFVNILPVNMAGEYDHFDLENSHVIPAMIRKIQSAIDAGEQYITLWGDGSPTREFIDARDTARAIRMIVDKEISYNEPINIGSGKEISIKDLAVKIADLMGYKGEIHWDVSKSNGQMRRCLDITKAKEIIGFEPEIPLEDTLKKVIKYWNRVKE